MTTKAASLLTADDLLRLYGEGVRGELIRGELSETMPTGQEHGEVVMNLGILLGNFIKPQGLGRLMGSDTGVLLERDPDTVREPDVAFISAERLPTGVRVRGYSEVVPDLVVEVVSPGDGRGEVYDKARMWISHGARMVWVADPDTHTVEVHEPSAPLATLEESDTLSGGDVLPGFSCPVRDVFDL